MLYIPQSLRQCTKCNEWKPVSKTAYYLHHGKFNGACKTCEKTSSKERRAQYRREYRDRVLEQNKKYYQANKTAFKLYNKEWKKTESGRLNKKAEHARRKARKLTAGGQYTTADIQRQYDTQQGRCYYCNCDVVDKYHVDHFIPLAKGGSNSPENIVIACPTCNMTKNARMPDEFLARKQS